MADRVVRSVHGAVAVPGPPAPLDTVHFRLFHPARPDGSDAERLTGMIAPDPEQAPWPVVIVMPGINVGADGYRWLACRLADAGYAAVTYELITEIMPGQVGISPGLDLDRCRAGQYGTAPSATAVAPLLAALAERNADGPLAGLLDLDRVVLAGHSAGGTTALLNASPEWFPVVAVVTYAAHTMASVMLGHAPETVLALPGSVPTLLLGGELDGVVAASAERYEAGAQHDPIRRTFDEAVVGGRGDACHAVLRGATHTVVCDPPDPTSARGFLDPEPTVDPDRIRSTIAGLTLAFLDAHVRGLDDAVPVLDSLLADDATVAFSLRK